MRDTSRYEIFKEDPPRSPRWLEAVEGLEQAMNRLEELAANDPSSDYYLYSNQADKLRNMVGLGRVELPTNGLGIGAAIPQPVCFQCLQFGQFRAVLGLVGGRTCNRSS